MGSNTGYYLVYVDKLESLMKAKKLTYTNLLEKFGIDGLILRRIRYQKKAGLPQIKRLADIFNLEMEDIADVSSVPDLELKRIKLDLTCNDVAKIIGCSANTVRRVEVSNATDSGYGKEIKAFFDDMFRDLDEEEDYKAIICKAVMAYSY